MTFSQFFVRIFLSLIFEQITHVLIQRILPFLNENWTSKTEADKTYGFDSQKINFIKTEIMKEN